jgi:hypothetical protein
MSREFTEAFLTENGLLDEGQPTRQATERHRERMRAEFTPEERHGIRAILGPATQETDPEMER